MTKRERTEAEINERRSRFVWSSGDIEIIKGLDVSPQADPDQHKGETPNTNDQASDQALGKHHESKKR